MPSLSVCLITKNEEACLARCLESVRGLADEIVLVDTGSTDRTVEIARACGARIFEFPWQDDFSLARNHGLAQATGDWILAIDADETIAARDHAVIRALIDRDDLDAVTAAQRHYLTSTGVGWQAGDGGYEEGTPYRGFVDVECRRLFRNRPWLRFQHPVHEELISHDSAHPMREARGAWVIHHFGKVGGAELLRAKGETYLRIGMRKAADRPKDPLAHYELGMQYGELGRPADAIPCFQRALKLSSRFRDAQLQLGISHGRLGQHQQALTALRLAARALPQLSAEIAVEEGNVLRAQGDDVAAEQAFLRALTAKPAFPAAAMNLALLYIARQRHADALACLQPLGPHDGAMRLRARILTQARRFPEARACLAVLGDAPDASIAAMRGAVALGFGELAEAVRQLRASVQMQGTFEAAVNLSIALTAQGDHAGALAATADALRWAPEHSVALTRFGQLAGDRFRQRATVSDRLTICFYQPRSIPFDGRTPRARGIGGTESAVVYLAEALARVGHRVIVFNHCDAPGTYDGVEYARWETMPARCVADRPDVLVGVRFWQAIGKTRFAPLQIFWTGDAYNQPFLQGLADPQARTEIDLVMLQSDWQADTFQSQHQVPASMIVRTRLGAAASSVEPPLRPEGPGARPRRLAYVSTPFRGLDVLLTLFPRIRAACPDAELDVFSSMRVYGLSEAEDQQQFGALYRKAKQPGVNLIGSLPQLELAERLRQSRLLAYPNHYPETFCIAAIEAEAAGCAVVTSALGALPETAGDAGIFLTGDPNSAVYQQAFVDACVRLLRDDEAWQAMSARALERSWDRYTWPAIAGEWDALCRAALANTSTNAMAQTA